MNFPFFICRRSCKTFLQAMMSFMLAVPLLAGPSGESGLLSIVHMLSCTCDACPQHPAHQMASQHDLESTHRSCCASASNQHSLTSSGRPFLQAARDSGCHCCSVLNTTQQEIPPLRVAGAGANPVSLAKWVKDGASLLHPSAFLPPLHSPLWQGVQPPGQFDYFVGSFACALHGARRMSAQGSSSIPVILGCSLL